MTTAEPDIGAAVLGLQRSDDLPAAVDAALVTLAQGGIRLAELDVYLRDSDEEYRHAMLLPGPTTWARRQLPVAERQASEQGAVVRQSSTAADGTSTELCIVPVGHDVVVLLRVATQPLTDPDLRACAAMLAVLARRAADLQELEETRAKLGQLDEDLIALHDGSLDLSGEDVPEVARKIVLLATGKLGFDRAGVFLIDDAAGVLRGAVGIDQLGGVSRIRGTTFPLRGASDEAQSELSRIARGELPYFLTQNLDGEGRHSREGNIEACAQVPMRVGDRTLGVLSVDNYFSRRPIRSETVPQLMVVANHGAATLANIGLQADLRRARDELEVKVEERTAELARTNSRLLRAMQSGRESRAAEERTQQRLEHVLSSGPAVVYSCRLESGLPLTFVSHNAMALIGYTADELVADVGLWVSRIHADDIDAFYTETAKVVNSGRMALEYRIRHRDGRWRWVHDQARVVRTQMLNRLQESEVFGSWLDITSRKEAEEARRQAVDELEKQQAMAMRSDRLRSLGEMAAGIAHELNQPLAGVRGIAEHILLGLARDWDQPREKMQERAQKIVDQADRMIHIIEHVRIFAREAGRPEVAEVDVNEVAAAAVDMHAVQFRSWGLELELQLQEGLPKVLANAYSLEEVFLNLLSNARDAAQERVHSAAGDGGGRVTLRTELAVTGSVRVEVADNGTGVDVADLERVFEPFYTTKGPDKGTGLGLSISKSIVEQFGGRMWIESNRAEGTRAVVLLPPVD